MLNLAYNPDSRGMLKIYIKMLIRRDEQYFFSPLKHMAFRHNEADEHPLLVQKNISIFKQSYIASERSFVIHKIAAQILEISSFLHRKDIPIRFFIQHYATLFKRTDGAASVIVPNAISTLNLGSLVNYDSALTVEKATQIEFYSDMNNEQKRHWTSVITVALTKEIAFDKSFIPHVRRFIDHVEWSGIGLYPRAHLGYLISKVGEYLIGSLDETKMYTPTETTFLVLLYSADTNGIQWPTTRRLDDVTALYLNYFVAAQALWSMAEHYKDLNMRDEAETLYQQAQAVVEIMSSEWEGGYDAKCFEGLAKRLLMIQDLFADDPVYNE